MRRACLSSERKWLIFAGFLICGGGQGILVNTLSAFVKPVTEALGFARGPFTLYASITSLVSLLLLPLYGELYRKKWFPKFMVLSAVICGLVPMGFSYCRSLPAFYFLSAVLGLFFHGTSISAVANILTKWFGRNRGFATGISFSGSGIVAALILNLANATIQNCGWEWGYRVVSAGSLLLLLVGTLIVAYVEHSGDRVLLDDPEFQLDGSETARCTDMTLRQAVGTLGFWGIVVGGFLLSYITQAGGASIMAYCSDLGYSSSFQSHLASISMLALAVGKILTGRILDRHGLRWGFGVIAVSVALYAGSLLLLRHQVSAVSYVLFYGMSASGSTVLVSYSVANAFGRQEYSRIYSLASIGVNLGVMAGNSLPGLIYDHSGSYAPAWWLSLGLAAVIGIALFGAYRDISARLAKQRTETRVDACK